MFWVVRVIGLERKASFDFVTWRAIGHIENVDGKSVMLCCNATNSAAALLEITYI